MMRQSGIGRQCAGSKFFSFAVEMLLPGEVTSNWGASGAFRRSQRVPADCSGGVRHVGDVCPIWCFCKERGMERYGFRRCSILYTSSNGSAE